jgi:serine/threonine-protein kinase RsbW
MRMNDVCTVRARMDCLGQAIAFVESFCAERGVARADMLRLSLVVEELFTNTVTHGHGGDSDAPVRIALGADARELELAYDDTAPPFDPLAHAARSTAAIEGDASERQVGQLGIALVAGIASQVGYVREDGWNRLRVVLRCEG